MGRLSGKRALITGAASGIGAACAARFAEEGARVAGIDLREPPDAKLAAFAIADVSDDAAVGQAVAAVRAALGGIDVVVNAAGVAGGGPVHLIAPEEWDRVIDVNLKGSFHVSRHVVPVMLESGGGSIVHVASVEGLEGFEGGSAYNASKGGVVLLTRNMAIDYGRKGIRVNAICPGFIETPLALEVAKQEPNWEEVIAFKRRMHPIPRPGKLEEVGELAVYLACDLSGFMTGQAIAIDGGFTTR